MTPPIRPPQRTVHNAEASAWLADASIPPGTAFITSLPDVSESGKTLADWRPWFIEMARLVLSRCPHDGVAIFYQTDIKVEGHWVDKGHLCQLAADSAGVPLLWHAIVCRKPPGTLSFGRPAYSHMLCFAPQVRPNPSLAIPDVLPGTGAMAWSRAMGQAAATVACRWIRAHTTCTTVIDPFCGTGTALATANALGLDAVGVDLSPGRCKKARNLVVAV